MRRPPLCPMTMYMRSSSGRPGNLHVTTRPTPKKRACLANTALRAPPPSTRWRALWSPQCGSLVAQQLRALGPLLLARTATLKPDPAARSGPPRSSGHSLVAQQLQPLGLLLLPRLLVAHILVQRRGGLGLPLVKLQPSQG